MLIAATVNAILYPAQMNILSIHIRILSLLVSLLLSGCRQESPSPITDSDSNQHLANTLNLVEPNSDKPLGSGSFFGTFVYRHHHTQMENLADKTHDHDLVLKLLADADIGYISHGSLGREGDQYEIFGRRDVAKWTQLVTELIDSGELKYYTAFGLDELGLGFVDLAD